MSKKLDPVASGWPTCLKAVATVALLVKDADKLTLGQQITVVAPHSLKHYTLAPRPMDDKCPDDSLPESAAD